MDKKAKDNVVLLGIFSIALLAFLGYGGYRYYGLSSEYRENRSENEQKILALRDQVSNLELERTSLTDALTAEQSKNDDFERQINKISSTVDSLTKLSKIDPELLKKYSKVYFLNENYLPQKLSDIPTGYIFDKNKPQEFQTNAWYFLKKLLDDAEDDDLELKVLSAYRSFGTQAVLKNGYRVTYGAGSANQFSADQGYSEHQLGTAVDFTNPTVGASLNGFERTNEYEWLTDNAYKYGFVLSYPEDNSYYQFEPWHWRFVGVDLAERLHDRGEIFYEVDQRVIDSYLIKLFDK